MTMNYFGLVDTENIPVTVLHYSAPTVILFYFIGISSVSHGPTALEVPVETTSSASPSGGTSTTPFVRRIQPPPSSLLKWVFVFSVLTFVCYSKIGDIV
jgi:hypothetical protein